ncbi:MAG: 4'-phosphopantetheinyl transferase superfamily protein [Chloroflexota bacterium]|nr:4'-phosphopantetheinyl transferase superfamily protein [Chloroflexota bacterium]
MISCTADLRALEAIDVGPSEVVYAFLSLLGQPAALDEALLDDEERARAMRFVRSPDRRRFVLAHAGLRLFLARCLDVQPAAVRYESGVHGKPRLARDLPALEFNLSHSAGLGLLAVARDRAVGVDVEHLRDVPEALNIADTHFSPVERDVLVSLPPADRGAAFFRCWTRKEAVIKALGEGLGRALGSFEVDLAPGSTSALARFDGRPGNVAGWSLRDLTAPTGYTAAGAAAVALRAPPTRWRELSIEGPDGARS